MADSTELKIHIVSDADVAGFNQAATASKTLKVDTSDLSDETKKALGIFEGTNNELKKTPPPEAHEGIGRLNLRGHEMREIFSKLNEIIPGLGIAMRGLGEMSNEAGTAVAAGEGKVAAANEGLIASTGPLIVVVLAIQAAMQYWDLYKEKVKEVAEQQAAACDKIREATHAALEENKKYEEAMAKAVKP